MAYHLELDEKAVVPYLLNLDLSSAGREKLLEGLELIRQHGDILALEADRRRWPGSPYFEVEWLFRDPVNGSFHSLRLIVNDASAQFGVLRVVYADEGRGIGGSAADWSVP